MNTSGSSARYFALLVFRSPTRLLVKLRGRCVCCAPETIAAHCSLTIRSSRARFAALFVRYRLPHRSAATQAGLTQALGVVTRITGNWMFRFLIFCLVFLIYVGALLTVLVLTLVGPAITEAIGLDETNSLVSYTVGLLSGVIAAATIFGMPVVLLNINANLRRAVELLETMRQPPDLLTSVAPVLVDHALDSLIDA